ncbi:MAG: CPBP family intramembrane metalloprotease [Atopobiaceae bacterium]|nr:CPBP family intramembrane metalloprotease [Atopobiaceae bacterium]
MTEYNTETRPNVDLVPQPVYHIPSREPRGFAKLFQALGLIVLCDLIAGTASLILGEFGFDYTVTHYVVAIPCYILALFIIKGRSLITPRTGTLKTSWRIAWWLLTISVVLLLFDLISLASSDGLVLADDWLGRFGFTLIVCLGSSVTEEIAFRGLLLGGFLAIFGRTRKGIVIATVVTSVLFGLAHVVPLEDTGSIAYVQAALKALETAMFSLLLCVIVLETKSILGTITLHFFFNFCALVGSMLFTNTEFEVSYIDTGDFADAVLGTYVMLIVLQLPFVIRAIKVLRVTAVANRGAFWHYAPVASVAGGTSSTPEQINAASSVSPAYPAYPSNPAPASPAYPVYPTGAVDPTALDFSGYPDDTPGTTHYAAENTQRMNDGRPPLPLN